MVVAVHADERRQTSVLLRVVSERVVELYVSALLAVVEVLRLLEAVVADSEARVILDVLHRLCDDQTQGIR